MNVWIKQIDLQEATGLTQVQDVTTCLINDETLYKVTLEEYVSLRQAVSMRRIAEALERLDKSVCSMVDLKSYQHHKGLV